MGSEVYFKSDKMKQDEMGWACWSNGRQVNAYKGLGGRPQGGDYFRKLEVEGRIVI